MNIECEIRFLLFSFLGKIDGSRLCASTCMENHRRITEYLKNLRVKIFFVHWIELNLMTKNKEGSEIRGKDIEKKEK